MTERTGGCLCGTVRYRITADPVAARVCWCVACQHIAGNGTVNAMFSAEAVAITGSPTEYLRAADSGNIVRRRFCSECGSHLFADSLARPGVVVVRVGTLDEPSSVAPTVNIWSGSAPAWACLDPTLERIDGQPPGPSTQAASG